MHRPEYESEQGKFGHYIRALRANGYSNEEVLLVQDFLYEVMDSHDCWDRFRVARSWIEAEVKEYERIRESGCHGFFDGGLTSEKGTIRVGFNYGH